MRTWRTITGFQELVTLPLLVLLLVLRGMQASGLPYPVEVTALFSLIPAYTIALFVYDYLRDGFEALMSTLILSSSASYILFRSAFGGSGDAAVFLLPSLVALVITLRCVWGLPDEDRQKPEPDTIYDLYRKPLVRETLTREECESLSKNGYLAISSKEIDGVHYRVYEGMCSYILIYQGDMRMGALCLQFVNPCLPKEDVFVMRKLFCEADEDALWRMAKFIPPLANA